MPEEPSTEDEDVRRLYDEAQKRLAEAGELAAAAAAIEVAEERGLPTAELRASARRLVRSVDRVREDAWQREELLAQAKTWGETIRLGVDVPPVGMAEAVKAALEKGRYGAAATRIPTAILGELIESYARRDAKRRAVLLDELSPAMGWTRVEPQAVEKALYRRRLAK